LAQYATGILDFYHAAQNLWKGAKSWLDGRTQQARHWFTTARRRLRQSQVKDVLADLQAALELEGLPDPARETLTNLYNYLDKHRDHMDYAKFKELGLPIGSGMVESACKWLIQQRFKGVGMRWSEDGFNHLLHLRLAWVDGRFDDLFLLVAPQPKNCARPKHYCSRASPCFIHCMKVWQIWPTWRPPYAPRSQILSSV
jgi:hypothetical protein